MMLYILNSDNELQYIFTLMSWTSLLADKVKRLCADMTTCNHSNNDLSQCIIGI